MPSDCTFPPIKLLGIDKKKGSWSPNSLHNSVRIQLSRLTGLYLGSCLGRHQGRVVGDVAFHVATSRVFLEAIFAGKGTGLGVEVGTQVAIVRIGGGDGFGNVIDHQQGYCRLTVEVTFVHALYEDAGGFEGLATEAKTFTGFFLCHVNSPVSDSSGIVAAGQPRATPPGAARPRGQKCLVTRVKALPNMLESGSDISMILFFGGAAARHGRATAVHGALPTIHPA